jgi:hypothetical protein
VGQSLMRCPFRQPAAAKSLFAAGVPLLAARASWPRSSMSGRGRDEGAECRRETLIQSPWAVLLRRNFALESVEWPPIASSFPPLDPIREAGARTDSALSHRRAHRHLPLRCAVRCGACVDERRIVAGDESGRMRTRSARPVPTSSTSVRVPRRSPRALRCRTIFGRLERIPDLSNRRFDS